MFNISSLDFIDPDISNEFDLQELQDIEIKLKYDKKNKDLIARRAHLYSSLNNHFDNDTIIEAFHDYLELDEDNPDAIFLIAEYSVEELNEYDIGRNLLDNYYLLMQDSKRTEEIPLNYCKLRTVASEDIHKAKEFLMELKMDSANPILYNSHLASFWLYRSNFNRALEYINMMVTLEPNDVIHYLILLRYYATTEEWNEVLKIYNALKDITPEDIENTTIMKIFENPHERIMMLVKAMKTMLREGNLLT